MAKQQQKKTKAPIRPSTASASATPRPIPRQPGLLISQRIERGESSAYVGINRGELHWKIMADGFLELAQRGCSPFHSPDAEIYAVLTCLRHGVELYVKYMVGHVSDLPSIQAKKKFQPGHFIMENWNLITEELDYLAKEIEGHDFSSKIAELSSFIAEIDNWDVNGQTFRYPQDRKGKRNLDGVENINVEHLRKGVTRLRKLMGEIDQAIGEKYGV